MSPFPQDFENLYPSEKKRLLVANGDMITIKGVGYIHMIVRDANQKPWTVTMKAVYVPRVTGRIISVSQLQEAGHEIILGTDSRIRCTKGGPTMPVQRNGTHYSIRARVFQFPMNETHRAVRLGRPTFHHEQAAAVSDPSQFKNQPGILQPKPTTSQKESNEQPPRWLDQEHQSPPSEDRTRSANRR